MAKWHHVAAALGLAASLPWYAIAQENTGAPQPAEQDERVVLEADYVYEVRDENKLVAEGNVEALYQGRILRADKIVYDRTTEKVRASGNVIIIDETGSQQFADEIEVNSNLEDGYAYEPEQMSALACPWRFSEINFAMHMEHLLEVQ